MASQIQPEEKHQTDWTRCALCQVVTKVSLQCPVESLHSDKGVGYYDMSESLQRFHDFNKLPMVIATESLDNGRDIADAIQRHPAKWHKSEIMLNEVPHH